MGERTAGKEADGSNISVKGRSEQAEVMMKFESGNSRNWKGADDAEGK